MMSFFKENIIFSLLFSTLLMGQNEDFNLSENIETDSTLSDTITETIQNSNIKAKENFDLSIGFTGSVGFANGEYITNTPVGGSLVVTTPFGFKTGPLDLTLSLVVGSYNGEGDGEPLNALLFGAGANAILFNMVFSETHVGSIGEGLGVRNFSGISLEKLMKKGLNLPVNILIGGEGFIAAKADDRTENSTFWGGLGVRLDYNF